MYVRLCVFQGKAKGDRGTLWMRSRLQVHLRSLGRFQDTHAGKVLFVSLLVVCTFCVGLKSATFHSSIDQLWVSGAAGGQSAGAGGSASADSAASEPTGHHHHGGAAAGAHQQHQHADLLSTHQMIVQTVRDPDGSLLSPRGLLDHLALVQHAIQVTVTLFDM